MYRKTKRDYALDEMIRVFEDQATSGSFGFWECDGLKAIIGQLETERDYDKATLALDLGIERYPFQTEFYLLKSRLLMYFSQSDNALELLEKAETMSPYLPEIRLLRADIYCALECYDQSLAIINDLKNELIGQDRVELFIRESLINESMKDFNSMFYSLKQALEINPDNSEALEQIWMSVELSKKYQESVELHSILVDKNPYSHLAWYNLGHAFSCLGEYEKAIEALEYSFIIKDDFEAGYMDCAELCFQVKKLKKAYQIYEEANEMFGPDAEILVYMVECLLPAKNYTKAKKLLLEGLTIDPYNDEVHFYLGECHSAFGEWKTAIRAYNKAIKIEDRREEYYLSLARAYEHCADVKMADYYYKKATSVCPEQNDCWINYAKFIYKHNGAQKAYDVLQKADLFAVGPDLDYCRAAYLFALDKREEATSVLSEALQEDISWYSKFLEVVPELKEDNHIASMIRYYKG